MYSLAILALSALLLHATEANAQHLLPSSVAANLYNIGINNGAAQYGDRNQQNNISGMSTFSVLLVSTSVAFALAAGVSFALAASEHAEFREHLQKYNDDRRSFSGTSATASDDYNELAAIHQTAARSANKVQTLQLLSLISLGLTVVTAGGALLVELGGRRGDRVHAALTPVGLVGEF